MILEGPFMIANKDNDQDSMGEDKEENRNLKTRKSH